MKRVVVTGIGAVTPAGNTFQQTLQSLNAGRTGIMQATRFDTSDLPWKTAGELKGFDAGEFLSPKEIYRLDPFVQYAAAASIMAAEDAGLITKSAVSSQRSDSSLCSAGVIIGSSRGGISTMEREIVKACIPHSAFRTKGVSPFLMPATTISMAASYTAQKLGIKNHCLGISNACASGANAIGEAFRLIKTGYAEIVLAGGAEAPVCRICAEGYGISGALSSAVPSPSLNTPRPFDIKRDGFVLSEGACMLVLEDYEAAVKRKAGIYGEITGYGNTTDAFHITRPDPEGEARAILMSLKEAEISPVSVDYISTHGTGTQLGDIAEARAINMVFGRRAPEIPASAIKSITGHMLAASGALETAAALEVLKQGVIPPTINLREKDPCTDINIITEKRTEKMNIAISNTFGFGGVNAVIVLRKI